MPLGDSITYGSPVAGGYRTPLYHLLTNAQYNVDYIGTQTGNASSDLPEINHEGHGGWKISDASVGLYENIYGWFETIDDPHVVLLHIGTNDSGGGTLFTNAYVRLEALIDRIARCQPSAKIIVTSLMKRTGTSYDSITNYFNPHVPEVVARQQALGHNVTFLDMHAYLELTDMSDGLHPNAGGYAKMANAWFPALTNVIGTNVTANLPSPIRGAGSTTNRQLLTISFNKAVSPDTATNVANYVINNGLTVMSASISANSRLVTLTTSLQNAQTTYTVTMNGIQDTNTLGALTIPVDSQVTFDSPSAPTLTSATGAADHLHVSVVFSKAMSPDSATNIANYALSGGLSVTAASISGDHTTVTLTTTLQSESTQYTLTVNNVTDETAPTGLTIATDSTISFYGYIPRGYARHVPESTNYTLVYSLDLPNTADYATTTPSYSTNNTALVGPYSRVAYYLELLKPGGALKYLWVSMDAFTNRADKLGVPTLSSGELYQRYVTNMNVFCNVPGVTTGTGIMTGNLEFWPYNYNTANAKGVPNANAGTYDFGDECSFSANYACMQVHNYGASQVLFAINHWNANATLEIGIGNQPASEGANPDYTFTTTNAATAYTVKTLQVLVMCDPSADSTPPTPLTAQAGMTRRLVAVTFDEMLAASSIGGIRFALNNGVEVLGATLASDKKTVYLATTDQPAGITLTLSINGVRDLAGNPVPAGTSLTVAAAGLPSEVSSNIGSLANGYELVYALDIPVTGNFNASTDFYRINQSGFTGTFDRVAYYVELLKTTGVTQYLWTAMDAFTGDARKIGVPTLASGAVFQRTVSNLDVKSNVAGVSNGVAMAGGNIEFWYGNYSQTNALGIANASNASYDWGDRMDAGSHGCMQIHNAGLSQVLFAMNNWGADNQSIALGIGTRPTGDPDWTFANNAGTDYSRRLLYVLVHRAPTALPAEVTDNVPAAAGYQLAYTIDLPINGSFNTNSPAYYTVNNTTNSGGIASTFSRIAYFLELVPSGGTATQWVWTAMDAFTTDARKIAIPTNNCFFQQKVNKLQVRSNVGGIVTGDDIATGNIEIWPSDYTEGNSISIPNASATTFDFGDGGGNGTTIGYGCFQVHNYGASATQTLFAVNSFNTNRTLCVGIGNNSTGTGYPDWTRAFNAGSFSLRRLHVLVSPGGESDTTAPTLVRAVASRSLKQAAVSFSETLADSASTNAFYAINNGATVSAAALQSDKKTVILTTSALTAGQTYTLTVTGVRDRSSNGNLIASGSTASFTAPTATATMPNVLTNIAETAGYNLIHQLAIGNSVNWANGCNYTVDESRFAQTQAFDRVAYCLEVVTNGQYKWVYVSMNAFTTDLTKIGVPTADRGALWQQYVSNLNVYASDNVANTAVTTGTGIATGNIEFWPSNYGAGNDKSIPGASASAFDFGDGGGPSATAAGHGSMQVHNYLQSHTIFALNHFGANGSTPAIGIGNNTFFTQAGNQDPDWTFYYNAAQYTTKNLYVLVRPGASPAGSGTPPSIWSQPRSQTVYLGDLARMTVYAPTATAYQWRKNGALIPGATQSWLEFSPSAASDSGVYDVIVTGSSGYTTSSTATLTVYSYTRPEAPKPIRIMPLGDSITYGVNTAGGYRLPLYIALTNAGYNVDFVGTQTGNGAIGLPDSDHEGHSGWVIDQLSVNMIDWLYAINDPDVILLHIGTNDSGAGDFSNRVDRLDQLVTKIATNRPYANIVVSTLLPRSDNATRNTAITNLFNPYVAGKVLAQRALGRKVTYLDMYSYLTTSDLFDGLHPNSTGYVKMASAWLPAVTNVVSVYGDASAPALARASNLPNLQSVKAVFSKAMDPATATNIANYALSGGATISAATLSGDGRTVTLATSALTRDALYTLTVSNVKDFSWPVQRTVSAGSSDTFRATVRGYLANVPEASGYRLAYALDLPNTADYDASVVAYSTNNADKIDQPLSRIAYYLEIQPLDGDLTYVWVSMDAFTSDITKIGVPAKYTGTVFQRTVANMNVLCNASNVTSGTGITTGNIEFWPFDYTTANGAGISGADVNTYDFGDTRGTSGTYGSMQVHNYGAGQTLFALNNWNSGAAVDLGIGNQKTGSPDWTFANNGNAYPIRSLYVLVTTGSENTPPTLVSAQAGSAGTLVTVTFSEALLAASVDGKCFSLDGGVTVVSARLLADRRTVNLVTTPQPAGQTLTLTVSGVRDAGGGNAIASGSTITVAPAALPAEVTANAGSLADGYQLVYALDVPAKGNFNGTADFYRYDQSEATGAFDRVAYYMELVTAAATTQYVWTAMDAFTPYRKQTGVPTVASKAVFQQYVTNLDVKANVSGLTAGTGMAFGNIEFWPGSYSQANALGITNASASYFDFGDTRTSSGAGYGSMQIHNAGLSQVVFALNGFGSDGSTLDLGIGSRADNNKDWTQIYNSGAYSSRKLYVMVRPSTQKQAADLPTEIASNVPSALTLGYQVVCSITNIPTQGKFNDTSWAATNYFVDRRSLLASNSFRRIAYYLELQTATDAVPRYVWTSMDAFTTDPAKIGIPLAGTLFQQKVTNLDVYGNVASLATGTGIATGNIEFWPSDYNTQTNTLGIPNANGSTFDFGDGGASTSTGHGCMQVHNYGAQQTVWAINHFNNLNVIGTGIGNGPNSADPDYTLTYNAGNYTRKIFHVLVLPGGNSDVSAPTITGALPSRSLVQVFVTFSEQLSDRAASEGTFTLNHGATVTGATLTTNRTGLVLTTTALAAGQTYQLTVNGVRDRTSNGNLIAADSTVGFTTPSTDLPAVLTSVPEIGGYALIHQLAISNNVYYVAGCNYSVDESRFAQANPFDRIAYCLELTDTNGVAQWVYVSMDAFTSDLNKIGVPSPDRSEFYQQYVSNLTICASANVAGSTVVTGQVAVGNIEFWASNYSTSNTLAIPGANNSTYDFGDIATAGDYGSMQIHNFAASQTILAMNHFGGNGYRPCLGIGNCASPVNGGVDWTFNENANAYTVKNLYVFVRWGGTVATGNGPAILIQPQSVSTRSGLAASLYVYAPDATAYQWRKNGVWIVGATQPWFTFSPAQESDKADYDVLVYSANGATASASAHLHVYPAGTTMIVH
jgi:lysophospholipase L1-like esterase